MFSKLWEVSASATTIRTAIFTSGHFVIDVVVIAWITGASMGVATAASLVGPVINGIWFWAIDRWWSQRHADGETVSTEFIEA
jgi:uncharacterized membrane protein